MTGEGILETSITWTIVEEDFSKEYGKTVKTGPNRSAQICGKGNGFASKIALVRFDWQGDSTGLPQEAVLKITTCAGITELFEKMLNQKAEIIERNAALIHNNELNFYQKARTKWGFPEEVPIPVYYTGREYCKARQAGYFALEYFADCLKLDVLAENRGDMCTEVTRWMASITGWAIKHPEVMDELGKIELKPSDTLKDFFTYEKTKESLDAFIQAHPQRIDQAESMSKIVERIRDFEGYRKMIADTCEPPLFAHMDMWTGNVLWRKSQGEHYKAMAIIDWQVCEVGSPVNDLVRWITSALNAEELLVNRNHYLEEYYKVLSEKTKGHELPWKSLDKLIEAFERLFPLVMVPLVLMFIKPELVGMMLKNRPDDQKEEARENYMKKMFVFITCSIEYIEKYYS